MADYQLLCTVFLIIGNKRGPCDSDLACSLMIVFVLSGCFFVAGSMTDNVSSQAKYKNGITSSIYDLLVHPS